MELNLKYSQQSENLSRSLLREKTNEVEELK